MSSKEQEVYQVKGGNEFTIGQSGDNDDRLGLTLDQAQIINRIICNGNAEVKHIGNGLVLSDEQFLTIYNIPRIPMSDFVSNESNDL